LRKQLADFPPRLVTLAPQTFDLIRNAFSLFITLEHVPHVLLCRVKATTDTSRHKSSIQLPAPYRCSAWLEPCDGFNKTYNLGHSNRSP
jgi:hypothetical protein